MSRNQKTRAVQRAPLPGDWAQHAACRGTAPVDGVSRHPFFPSRGEKVTAETLALCDACPVLAHCRHYALLYPVTGWWGGMDEDTRRRWRREHKRAS